MLFAWLLVEDLPRKYLGNNMTIFFAKDFLLAVVYLSFFIRWRRRDPQIKTFRPPFLMALMAFVWFGCLQVFNPASTSIFFGLMGVKLYFYYVPLIALGYALADSETKLRQFFYIQLILISVIVALGIAQSIIGPSFLNPAVMSDEISLLSNTYRVAPISHARVYRPPSVFVSAGRFANLLTVSWLMALGFSGYLLLRQRRGRIFVFLMLALIAAGCLMCASRGTFMWAGTSAIVAAAAFLWSAALRQEAAVRVMRAVQRVGFAVILAIVLLASAYPEQFLGRIAVYSETLDPRSPTSELFHRVHTYPFANFLAAFDESGWPYGYGFGTASLGGQYIAKFFQVRPPESPVESGFGDIVLETGIIGLILWLVMAFAIVFNGLKVVKNLRGTPLFPIAFTITLYSFLLLLPMTYMGIQAYQDFLLNSFMWLLIGILFRLPTLVAQNRSLAAEASGHSLRENLEAV